jgi:cupin 2 domain-containing protein
MPIFNLFSQLPEKTADEEFRELLISRNVRVERIVSPPHTATETMNQEQDEWIALLQGWADLEMGDRRWRLHPGDSLLIPARTLHRVLDTSDEPRCLWLTVHIHAEPTGN